MDSLAESPSLCAVGGGKVVPDGVVTGVAGAVVESAGVVVESAGVESAGVESAGVESAGVAAGVESGVDGRKSPTGRA